MKIRDVIPEIGNLPYLTIHVDCTLEEASKTVVNVEHLRTIYVVGHQKQLLGILSLGKLIRSLTAAGHKPYFHARTLLTRITAQKVADIMDKYVVSATKEDDPRKVLERMIDNHIKEITGKGQFFGGSHLEAEVAERQQRGKFPGAGHHLRGKVDPHHSALRPHQARRHTGVEAGAAAQVQDRLPEMQRPQAEGIAHPAERPQKSTGKVLPPLLGIAQLTNPLYSGGILETAG